MSDDIYTYIEQNFNIKITDYQFKRDYIKNPLTKIIKKSGGLKWELPNKDDLEFLYINLNLELRQLYKIFNINHSTIHNILHNYNIKKTTKLRKENNEKAMKRLYNVINQFQRPEIKLKCHTKEKIENGIKTRIRNKNWGGNTSKTQKKILSLLQLKFPLVLEDYKSDLYPFHCDFYIPSEDLYIEYQGYLTHGDGIYHCPFDTSNTNHLNHINELKQLKPYKWKDILDTWTTRDPLKRKIATDNKLNWLEFFNMKQFMEWYDGLI